MSALKAAMKKTLIAALLVLPLKASAEETAAFLKIGVGARPAAMGGAYTAVADDVNAIAWNPAGLSGLNKREVGAMHAALAVDTRYDFLGYAQPTAHGTLALSAARLSQGALEGRDDSGKPTGSFNAADTAVSVAFASRLESSARLGGAVKYLHSGIADASGRTFALDAGGMYALDRLGPGTPLLGLALQNLGPGMRFLDTKNDLPLTLAAGAGYALPLGLTLAADFRYRPYARKWEASVGTEYAVLSFAALRFGYASRTVGARSAASGGALGELSGLSGLGAGFGIRLSGYTLDYSFSPAGELGSVQRFSLGARF